MLNQRGRSISARRATGAEEAESEHPENEMKNAPAVVTGAMLYPTEKCTKTATCTTKLYMQMFLFDPFRFSLKIVLYIASLFMGRVSKMSVLFSLSFDSSLFFCVFFFIYLLNLLLLLMLAVVAVVAVAVVECCCTLLKLRGRKPKQ